MKKGRIIVVAAPSGGGKNTLIKSAMELFPEIKYSISATTRPPRGNEKHGVNYFFLTKEEFERRIEANEFVEYKHVYGNIYGTLKSFVDRSVYDGVHTIYDVDIQGAMAIKEKYNDALLIFILPPSLEILEQRLKDRGEDTPDEINKRLACAEEEMKWKDKFDYIVINDKLNEAIEEFTNIIKNECNLK